MAEGGRDLLFLTILVVAVGWVVHLSLVWALLQLYSAQGLAWGWKSWGLDLLGLSVQGGTGPLSY